MKHLIYILIIVGFGAAITTGLFIEPKFKIASLVDGLVEKFNGLPSLRNELENLKRENADLKAFLLDKEIYLPDSIKVFSSYPFNNAKEIAIASGRNNNLREGDVVMYGSKTLIGRIKEVFDSSSIVTTIFHQGWEMPVRIGAKEIDALFHGGNTMKLTLIPKNATIAPGDAVISAEGNLPYGLLIGHIKDVIENVNEPFREATIEPIVKLGDLKNVSIYK